MNKLRVQSLNECFNVSGEDFIEWEDDYEVLSSSIPTPMPEEIRESLRISLRGNTNGRGNSGKIRTEEAKKKISNSVKKLWEEGAYLSRKNGHKREEKNPWYGRKHSEESIIKQKNVKCKYLYEVADPNGILHYTDNLRDFCPKNGLNAGLMYKTANGKIKHHKGWRVIQKDMKSK